MSPIGLLSLPSNLFGDFSLGRIWGFLHRIDIGNNILVVHKAEATAQGMSNSLGRFPFRQGMNVGRKINDWPEKTCWVGYGCLLKEDGFAVDLVNWTIA
ncbi:hypothetical protein HQ45_07885 [Porphyromonas crevioricanis]|uniref:Uncharacterized protein n=2 Tax=Porphyromonas crevioricanis TaxID=393921 RepID=A0A0A2FDU4_9PORP|nr:hypothetical protein [Porphyromonas crevioricanis]KGN89206.1 hypothetical protein HQ45_07885 [Porphyromonas crevioricanis]SJZ99462.1 hypothetical protein SAMN02745203_01520 [Porphyromonas crevioricanis]SQH72467.1 Uncharacterised protein [Porphyromonas crevioricanis]GAD05217.1 hypothetical protein PORCRE_917 [Porphyromonas crevioricanis JCM 15906]GAD06449.1 hypothetical protein PORCAN_45 [Porphyromonas crevioricanis JCM 13913]